MTHPVMAAAAVAAVVIAVGAGTALVLPRAKPEPRPQTLALDLHGPDALRIEPLSQKSDAERVDDLQRQLSAIAAEHKRLSEAVRAAATEAARKDRERKKP